MLFLAKNVYGSCHQSLPHQWFDQDVLAHGARLRQARRYYITF